MTEKTSRPIVLGDLFGHKHDLRYGENPQQGASFFTQHSDDPFELGKAVVEKGRDLSYVNVTDPDRALNTIIHAVVALQHHTLRPTFCAIAVKHGNPCGAGYGNSPEEALGRMILSDVESIFGGVVITNFLIGHNEAHALLHLHHQGSPRRVLDIVIAPGFTNTALKMLERKEDRCIMVSNPALAWISPASFDTTPQCRAVRKGYLVQERYNKVLSFNDGSMQLHGQRKEYLETDLAFAAALCRTSNSNTITIVKDSMLLGQGVAQTSRVRAAEVALYNAKKSGHEDKLHGSVVVSDSFFPFHDGLTVLTRKKVAAVFCTTGSLRDEEVRKACPKRVTLYQLPDKNARMFFGH